MQRKSLGKHIAQVFTPILVRYLIALVVEMIFIGIMGIDNLVKYSVEIGSLGALITIPILVWMTKKDRMKEEQEGFVFNKIAPYSKYVFLVIMSIAVAIGLNNILLLANVAEYSADYQETAEAMYATSFPMQMVALGIIYPVMEEYIFRGLIFRRIRCEAPPMYAIVTSAVLFSIYHGNSVQMIYAIFSGIMFGYFYEKYGSLKAPIVAHVVMNMTSLLMTEFDGFTWMFVQPVRMVVVTILCAAIGAGMFVLIRRIDEKQEG